MTQRYRVGQFAALTGVSIRTLHHYDSIGLLSPSDRSEAGYRLYSDTDLLLVQQILTLRYLGFGLRQIGELLRRPDFDLLTSLRIQRGALRDRISELERIDVSLGTLLDHRLASGRWNWRLLTDASTAVQAGLEQKGATMNDYYTPEEIRRQFTELAREAPPEELQADARQWREELQAAEQQWRGLLADVHANLDLPPASPKAQELAARWDQVHESARPFFQGREKLWQSLGRAHLDGRYDHLEGAGHAEDYAFIQRVKEAATT
ncbi:MAG: MerR family transcriptional regulator [Chloroflexota bacterium]|nr:MerR family transcriptional regulator [Chloroflexota bacterium]